MCPHEKKLARRRAGNLNDCTTTAVGQLLFLLNHGASTLLKQSVQHHDEGEKVKLTYSI